MSRRGHKAKRRIYVFPDRSQTTCAWLKMGVEICAAATGLPVTGGHMLREAAGRSERDTKSPCFSPCLVHLPFFSRTQVLGFFCASFHRMSADTHPWPRMMKRRRACSKTAIRAPIRHPWTSTDPSLWQPRLNIGRTLGDMLGAAHLAAYVRAGLGSPTCPRTREPPWKPCLRTAKCLSASDMESHARRKGEEAACYDKAAVAWR